MSLDELDRQTQEPTMTYHHQYRDRLDEYTDYYGEEASRPRSRRRRHTSVESYSNQRVLTGIAIGTMVVLGCGIVAAAIIAPKQPSANAFAAPITRVDENATTIPVASVLNTSAETIPSTAAPVQETQGSSEELTAETLPTPLTAAPPTNSPNPTQPPTQTETETVSDVRTGPDREPLLFWQWGYVGRWAGEGFEYSSFDNPGPDWLVGSTVELRNPVGSTHVATVVNCNGLLALSPAPPYSNGFEAYWYTHDQSFTYTDTNDDSTLAAMNEALTNLSLSPANAVSYGAPLAADGSADRLLFYKGDGEYVWWIATFDVETATFTTLEGEPASDPGYEMGIPPAVWTDLDQDGNLESVMFRGDTSAAMEWASGSSIWDAGQPIC